MKLDGGILEVGSAAYDRRRRRHGRRRLRAGCRRRHFGGIHLDPMDLRWIPGALLLPWTVPGRSGRFQRVVVGIREALELFKFKWG